MLEALDFSPLLLTLHLAVVSTLCLMVISLPVAWWIVHGKSVLRPAVATVVTLPLVLPPSVLGFYLLLFLGPNGPGGKVSQWLGLGALPFTFTGLVIASVIYSLPFAVQPLQNAFKALGKRPLEAAATLGATPLDCFFTVALPLARSGLLTALVLSFAHTVGEFGVVLMIGGNIPGETKVLSVAIYEHVESQEYASAHLLSALMLAFCFAVLFSVQWLGRKQANNAL